MQIVRFLFFALLLAGLAGASRPAHAQRAEWARMLPEGTTDINTPSMSATDAAGNTYVSGYFRGTMRAGGFTLTAAARDIDLFVAKLDAAGAVQWLRRAGGPRPADTTAYERYDRIFGLALGANGDVLLAGLGSAGFTFGTFGFDSVTTFLTRLDGATGTPALGARTSQPRHR